MTKKRFFSIVLFSLVIVSAFSGVAGAYWLWTPETKKFVNPKYAVKDSPKEQFDWAMSFYSTRDFQRAATEFEKLAKQYEFSEYASKAQYYVGLCYENMNKYYLAYQNYQKAIDNFPHIANTEEILAREFAIANLYLSKPSPKVLGTDIMAPLDRAVEIFRKVVENAPYGKFAEESQFKLGEALKKSERYEEAVQTFHKLVEDYPKSKLATQAMYEESNCAYKASLKPAYDAAATDNAIKTFEKFVYKNKDADLAKNADTTMKRLKDNVAEKSFKAAEFYETQGKTQAAIIYYQDVIDAYPESAFVNRAKAKIEALKAIGTKKAAVPIDLSKKKPKQVTTKEKKPWRALKFESRRPQKKAEAATSEVPKKKAWSPLSFKSEKKNSGMAAEATQTKEPAKNKPWNLFDLGAKKEPVAKEAPKKAWKPFSFEKTKKAEPQKAPVEALAVAPTVTLAEVPVVTQTPVADIKKEDAVTPIIESPVVEAAPQIQEAPKEKGWKPLNFDTKKESVAGEARKNKGWKPLYFGTNDEPMATTNRRW
ncbi:MAG: outer membrane protein assembly factor BamD [Candidatus Omnitrophota bacterium]|nr:outer membrane protein assembly factor BamD [Candidatus Omnitrophota bacterium]